jgi:alginate production protein
VPDDDYRYDIYAIAREDRTELENSPYYLGVRATGEPGRHLRFWADLVHGGGERGRREDKSTPVRVRRVDAFAFDAGVLLRPRIALDPTFVASYAMASGDPTNDLPVDEQPSGDDQAFRQTGLHRNRDKYRGNVSFRYYGDAVDPELSNLRIATLAAGIRPVRAFSVDLAFHRYEQDEASVQIVNSDIDADPSGADPYLGKEWNLIVGYEPSPHVELRFTSGYFDPGPAFGPGASSAKVVRFQSKFRF